MTRLAAAPARALRMVDAAAPQAVNIRLRPGGMTAETDDPQIIFKPAEPMPAGWYRFSVVVECEEDVEPQVFFDFGSGFVEVFSARLKRTGRGHRYALDLKLPFAALLVRIDPTDRRGDFTLSDFVAEPLSAPRVAAALARHGLAVARADPRRFFTRLPTYLGALGKPYFLRLADPNAPAGGDSISYEQWLARHDFRPERDAARLRDRLSLLETPPLISVLMPVYNTPKRLLEEAIESVRTQIYPHWQLCIADDCSTKPYVRRLLERRAAQDPRIRVVFREANGHISHATNSAFELAEGEWIALLDHDDVLRPHALAEVALEIAAHPGAQIVYSDEDKLDAHGHRCDPFFKPEFSRELFRSQNYLNHLTVHRAENIRAVGNWRPGFEGSQDYDLNLRILERIDEASIRHIPKVLYHWRAVEGSTAAEGSAKTYAYTAGLRALQDHVARLGLPAVAEAAPGAPFYRLRYAVPEPAPLVSLIIPTRDHVDLLRGCIESIRARTDYPAYEIIVVDNGSVEPASHAYLDALRSEPGTRVLAWDKPFNYSAINNFAAAQARGSILGLVNNDIVVISPGWLTEMVSWAAQEDVGCVGAKLYYANETIQHAGVILGVGGVAGHSHKHFPRDGDGYFARLKLLQNLSAVTAACLVVRKSVYEAVGGLDEQNLPVAFNDVDFCLKVRDAGWRNVWTPYAELYHLESVSRGTEDDPVKQARFAGEVRFMRGKWGDSLDRDPYYSPNLTLSEEDFSLFH
jgi:GT2 family glycosyltransferase